MNDDDDMAFRKELIYLGLSSKWALLERFKQNQKTTTQVLEAAERLLRADRDRKKALSEMSNAIGVHLKERP